MEAWPENTKRLRQVQCPKKKSNVQSPKSVYRIEFVNPNSSEHVPFTVPNTDFGHWTLDFFATLDLRLWTKIMGMRIGTEMPSLDGATEWFNGTQAHAEAEVKGQPTLVHFWSVSCGMCKDNMPRISQW